MARAVVASWLTGVIAAIVAVPGLSHAADAAQRARSFLEVRRLGGAVVGGGATIDAFESLAAVSDPAVKDGLLVGLLLAPADNLESAFLRSAALATGPYADPAAATALLDTLRRKQLGLAPGARGLDPLVLAAALRFAAAEQSSADAATMVELLRGLKRADGSFGFADNDGDVAPTAEVARVLGGPGGVAGADLLAGARTWLHGAVSARASLPAADLALLVLALGTSDATTVRLLSDELTARQAADGSFDGGDVRATALAVQALAVAMPDLVLRPPSLLVETPTTGRPFTYGVVVSNVGATASAATTIEYTVVDGVGATVLTGTAAVPPLAPGQQLTTSLDLGVQGAVGPRRLTAIVNAASTVAEGTYDNDVLVWDFRVADKPDLEITAADIAVSPSPPMTGGEARVTVRVRNVGEAVATNVHVQLFQGEPGAGGVLLGEEYFNAVANGTPRVFAAKYLPSNKDPVRLVARVDPEGAIPELRKDNNVARRDVAAVAPGDVYSDLTAQIYATNNLTRWAQGDKVEIRFQVGGAVMRFGNIYVDKAHWGFSAVQLVLYMGTGTSQGAEVARLWVDLNPTFGYSNMYVPSGTPSGQVAWPVPSELPAGRYRFTAVADPDNISNDVNLANNTKVLDVEVTNPGVAELYVAQLTSDSPVVDATHHTTVRARVANSGQASGLAIPVSLALPRRTAQASIPSLLPGEAFDVAFVVTSGDLNLAQNLLTFTIDPQNVVSESSKQNNTAQLMLYGTSSGALALSAQQLAPPTACGQPAPLQLSIRNTGYVPLTGCTATASLNVNYTVTATVPGSIDPGVTTTLVLPFPTNGLKGTFRLDPWVGCPQGSASVTTYVTVANADLAVAPRGITLSPEAPLAGQPTVPTVVVNNLGAANTSTSVRIYRGYPEQGELVSSGTVQVAAGGSTVFTGPAFTAREEPPYVITVVLDEENAVTESDETNNVAVRTTLKRPGDVVVSFDEVHSPSVSIGDTRVMPLGGVTAGITDYARDLTARGYTVKAITPGLGALTPANLLGTDVLVAAAPMASYRESELRLIREFVEAGGGYFYLGDRRDYAPPPLWAAPGDQILGTFGVTGDNNYVLPGNYPCVASWLGFTRSEGVIKPHVVTTGVNGVNVFWAQSFSSLPANAEPLLKTPATWMVPNAVVSAVFPVGNGRVALHGDSNLMDADFSGPGLCGQISMYYGLAQVDGSLRSWGDNRRFSLQLVDYLAKGGLGDWKPDLTFAPAQLTVSQSTITSGDRVQVKAVVRNVGGTLAAAGETVVRLYDGAPGTGKVIGEQRVPDLLEDQEYEVAFDWDTTYATGRHTLTAVVDPDNLVDEFAEDNNTVAVAVEVRRGVDLRVDPSDVVVTASAPPVVSVRVHNLGYAAAAVGGTVRLHIGDPATTQPLASLTLPSIPARSAVTVSAPWQGAFPQTAFDLWAVAVAPPGTVDADPRSDAASIRFEPPTVAVQAPAPADRWGGRKTLRWSASGTRRPNVSATLSVGPWGGALTTLGAVTTGSYDLDTSAYPDGEYVVRLSVTDGLQTTVQDVPVRFENAGLAVRQFTGAAATVALGAAGGTAKVPVPVGSRITSASLLVDPVASSGTNFGAFTGASYGTPKIVEYRGALYGFYWMWVGSANAYAVLVESSFDGGATWSAPRQVSGAGVSVDSFSVATNSQGIYVAYTSSMAAGYTRSADGITWSAPTTVLASHLTGYAVTATEQGVAMGGVMFSGLGGNYDAFLALAPPDGSAFVTTARLPALAGTSFRAWVGADQVHALFQRSNEGHFYSQAPLTSASDGGAWAPRVSITPDLPTPAILGMWFDDTAIGLTVLANNYIQVQRCPRAWDCRLADSWLPERIVPSVSPFWSDGYQAFATAGIDDGYVEWCTGGGGGFPPTTRVLVRSFGSGSWWTESTRWSTATTTTCGGYATSFYSSRSGLGFLDSGSQNVLFRARPELTPLDLQVDVGADGTPELALPGMIGLPLEATVLADAMNAYLASHADGDDGTVDGYVAVPIAVASRGAGGTTLRNLEVRYQPASAVAALADPPVFSPTASPGVLDLSTLSVLATGPIAVTDLGGATRRTLASTASGGRYVATFDGRDALGAPLPSGAYRFGVGAATGEVEIDDLPPTVELRTSAEGNLGGFAPVYGRATDQDWAGTAKNFSRYMLDWSRDGATWSVLATSSRPADGVLGTFDTHAVATGPVTLRLTAWDRAGNSSTTSRTVGVSPNAPIAPVIDAPTIAGRPLNAMTDSITVAGTAEVGTTVTVLVGGVAAGTAKSDGRWSLSGVKLPAGVSTITASASRNGLESARAQEIVVAQYALTVAMDVPPSWVAGTTLSGTVSVTRASVEAAPLTVRLSARDATGAPASVGLTPTQQVVAVPAAGTASFDVHVGAPELRAGTYTLVAEVVSGGLVPASTARDLTFTAAPQLAATLYSDKAVYRADQIVGLEATVSNLAFSPTGDLHAALVVYQPGGTTAVLGPYAVRSIPAGGAGRVGALFGNPPLALGVYLADVEVKDEFENVVATASTSFEVRTGTSTALSGRLAVTPPVYAIGPPLQAGWSVTNAGPAETVAVSVLLVRASDGFVFRRLDQNVPLPAGATVPGSWTIATTGTDGQEIVAVLLGDGDGLAAQTIAAELIADTTPPVIEFQGVVEGQYATSVTPIVVVTEASAYTTQLTLNGSTWVNGTPVTIDAEYVLSVHAVDVWGNSASASRHFTIDSVRPAIAVSGVVDGALGRTAVTPVVTVTDLHLRSESILLDRGSWSSGSVSADGDHVLEVFADDLAGNATTARVAFTIDTIPPDLVVTGVAQGKVYGAAVTPVVTVTDPHPAAQPWTATLNGAPWTGGTISSEGDYTLAVDAVDAAGNGAPRLQRQFAIDLTPPSIQISGDYDGLVTRNVVTPVIAGVEPHPATTTITLDGAPFVSGTPVTAEGRHTLVATATDAAGNVAAPRTIRFTRDTIPPVITVGGVVNAGTYYVRATPTFDATDATTLTVSATLDGASFPSGTPVTADGQHTLVVTATDAAGNPASKTVVFRVVAVQGTLSSALDYTTPRVLVVVDCVGQTSACATTKAKVLFAALTGAGIPYDYALDSTTFLQKIRDNKHNVRIVYRLSSSATNAYPELCELTNEGGGFILVNDGSPDCDPKLKKVIGVSTSGTIKTVGTVSITAGDLGSGRTLTVAGSGITQSVVDATVTVVGRVGTTKTGNPVVTTNRYGSGRAVTITLNPEANDNASMRDLLVQSVSFAARYDSRVAILPVPRVPQYVKLTSALASPAGPLDFQLAASAAAALTPLADDGTPTSSPRTWTFSLTSATPVAKSLGVLVPQSSATPLPTYRIDGALTLTTGGVSQLVSATYLDVQAPPPISVLWSDARTAAAAVSTTAATQLDGVTRPEPTTKANCDTSITAAVNAATTLAGLANGADARLKCDRLLRALQALRPTLP